MFAQYKPRITPAILIPPITKDTNIFLSTFGTFPILKTNSSIHNRIITKMVAFIIPKKEALTTILPKELYSLFPLIKSIILYITLFMLNTILSMIFLNFQNIFLFILPHNTFSKLIIYFMLLLYTFLFLLDFHVYFRQGI